MKVDFLQKFLKQEILTSTKNFSEVSTDTRTLKKDALFIAIRGENFNGNDFLEQAFEKGALSCITTDKNKEDLKKGIYYVKDEFVFLNEFGRAWCDHIKPEVIGITGSNGKTTTKFFVSQMLKPFKKLCYSPKSFNNHIGVPFTQLMLKEDDEVLVNEIGTSAPGEIKALTLQAKPHVSMVTTVGASHLEAFKTVENVAIEKEEIYKNSQPGKAIFNLDNPYTLAMYKDLKDNFKKAVTVSTKSKDADVFVQVKKSTIRGLELEGTINKKEFKVNLPVFGVYNVYNYMFAVATGLMLDIPEQDLLGQTENLQSPWGRSQILKQKDQGVTYIFDGYNSNLDSMTSLIDSLKSQDTNKMHLVFGEMLELGEETQKHHYELGKLAGALKPKSVIFVGGSYESFSQGLKKVKFEKNIVISDTYDKTLALKLRSVLDNGDTVVLKASRGTKIESVLKDMDVDFEALNG